MLGDRLNDAAAALAGGDRLGALEALLDGWRERRAPELADAVDALSGEIARALPPISGKSGKQRHERWLDLAGAGRAVDVPRLLALFDEGASPTIKERIERLAARPDDPRLTDALVAMCERPRFTSSGARPVWTALFDLLERLRDVRARTRLQAIAGARIEAGTEYFREPFLRRIARVVAAMPDPEPRLDDDEGRTLATIVDAIARLAAGPPATDGALLEPPRRSSPARSSTVSVEELTALVWAAPDDDEPRRVLADLLLERGDPYGDFLTLQLRDPATPLKSAEARRMRQLSKANQRAWLGPLEPVVEPKSVAFERGFLTRCTPRFRTARQREELLTHPAWSTVRELVAVSDPQLLFALPHVRRAHGLDARGFATVSSQDERPLALEALALANRDPVEDPELRAQIGDGRGLPRLVELTVGPVWRGRRAPVTVEDWGWILATPLGARLRRLRMVENPIYAEGLPIGAWSRALARHGTVELEALIHVWSWRLTRGPRGLELDVTPHNTQVIWRPGFESCVADLAAGDLAAIRLHRAPPLTPADEKALAALVAGRAPFDVV